MLLIALALALASIALAALLAAAETSTMLLPVGRVHRLAEAQTKGARELDDLLEKRHRLRAASALSYGTAAFLSGLTAYLDAHGRLTGAEAALSSTGVSLLALTAGIVAVGVAHSVAQALPRTLAVANPERIGLATAGSALPFVAILYPLARILGAPWRWIVEVGAKERTLTPWAVTPEFRGAAAGDEGEREEAEEALLEAVSDFAEKVAREVMVPRTDVAALTDTATVAEAIALIRKTGFSRLPVYHESIDDIRGVLYAKDLLVALGRGEADVKVADIARTPFFVPETKPVEELLLEMRLRTHIAVVADEYGGTAGIVTLEDLLEEIVGEISDEYDREEPLITDLGDGRFRIDARLPVDDLNELVGTDLDTETDSVGGLFTEVAGRIPEVGESMVIEGLTMTVTERQGTRILQLTVEPASVREREE